MHNLFEFLLQIDVSDFQNLYTSKLTSLEEKSVGTFFAMTDIQFKYIGRNVFSNSEISTRSFYRYLWSSRS